MKHLNFLSNLLSLSLGSPCTDVSLDRRLTVGSPSGLDAKWKQNPFMRFAVVLTLIFTIGSGNAWGATQNFVPGDFSGGTSGTGSTVNKTLNGIQVSTDKGYATTQFRVYKGGKLTISSDYTIKAINFTTSSGYGGGLSNQTNLTTTSWSFTTTAQARITQIVVTYLAKVTFNANGGSCATSSLTQSTPTSTITLPTPTRAGYTCTGWYTASSGGTKRGNAGATYTPSASETLYAQWESSAPACSNAVALSKGSATNGTVNTISSASVATCSATASDRRVTITITPDDCYDAPTNLTWTKSSGTVTASKQSGPTDNGDGTYSYVYQFAQNDNGAGTFGVTCTAKAAGKTVNFNAGPGSCGTSSLTETCDGSGVVLPSVTASGVCKGWTTFAGWRTSAIAAADSTTTNPGTLYAAGTTYYPSSNNETLYAVFSKTKGSAPTWTIVSDATSLAAGDSVIIAASGSAYAMSTTQNTNNRGQAGITKSGDNLSAITSGVQKFVLKAGTSSGTWAFYDGAKYIYAASSSSNHLKSQTTNDANGSFTISISSKVATITANGTNTNKVMQHNSGSSLFSCYGSASQSALALYKKIGGYTTYYCSDPNCCTKLGSINGSFF